MIEKHYTYADLPEKGHQPEIQYVLTDEIILEFLNRIVKDSNLLVSVDLKEEHTADELPTCSITFNLLVRQT